MKYLDVENIDGMPAGILKKDEVFSFRCHSGLACFNKCCRNLNLFIYPYDVMRLKKILGISSDEFLEKYTDVVMRPEKNFPEVLLRMSEGSEKECPFLTESGCSVYTDRPDTCRTFPVEQGLYYDAGKGTASPVYFFKPPDFCLGRYENAEWTADLWAKDQDAVLYNKMTRLWAEIINLFQNDPWRGEGPEGPKAKMAFMAAYNIDRFRDFIFASTFIKRYKIKQEIMTKIKHSDTEMLKFGFAWIKYFLWGISSKNIRQR
ncbi:MAG: YkgJ family cysteine cluster protein [Desulfobacteraceae bacterium]|nr:MAG: YkgJ family cysteine cluster protein [Desulfobacteraceae bacterium]